WGAAPSPRCPGPRPRRAPGRRVACAAPGTSRGPSGILSRTLAPPPRHHQPRVTAATRDRGAAAVSTGDTAGSAQPGPAQPFSPSQVPGWPCPGLALLGWAPGGDIAPGDGGRAASVPLPPGVLVAGPQGGHPTGVLGRDGRPVLQVGGDRGDHDQLPDPAQQRP